MQARWGGGAQTPTYGVLHSAETPLKAGYAASIANMFATTSREVSAHFMLDPGQCLQLRDTGLLAWHCGTGNTRSIGVEQSGYAAYSREQWLGPEGLQQLQQLAALMVDIKNAHGIGTHFMSDGDLLRSYRGEIIGGWATHDQCRRVLGGTTHTDPMPNFPFDALEQILGGTAPTPPAPQPAPRPTKPPVLAWPFPRGHYVGDIRGPANCHGGYFAGEREFVKNVQQHLIFKGCVPGVTNPYGGWADGLFQRPYSTDAAIRFHARYYPGQPYPDQIWSDDYAHLVA